MLKMICFDMDGTIADLYGVPGWLEMLEAHNPLPYGIAKPMCDMKELAELLHKARAMGIEIRIITWLAKGSDWYYDDMVRLFKQVWLEEMGLPIDHFHAIRHGATKADCIRKYLGENETAILVDDNEKVRKGWHMGETLDPTACDIVLALKGLLDGLNMGE